VIEELLEDREGAIWAAGWSPVRGRLCRIHDGTTQCDGKDGRFGAGVSALLEDSAGNLWAGAMTGLWRWKQGPPRRHAMPDPANRIEALVESDDGGILVAKSTGITKLRNGTAEPVPLPDSLDFRPGKLLRDRDGALWIGAVADRGLLHVHGGRKDLFTRSDGLSGNSVASMLEDREGNLWVGTSEGLAEPWWNDSDAQSFAEHGFKPRFVFFRAFSPKQTEPFALSVDRISGAADLALVRIDTRGRNIPVIPLDRSGKGAVAGHPVVVLGYPTGIQAVLAKADSNVVKEVVAASGTSSERMTEALASKGLIRPSTTQGHIGDITNTDVVFDASTSQGGSGGPVFNRHGVVMAVEYALALLDSREKNDADD
jgi:hypothetical protein